MVPAGSFSTEAVESAVGNAMVEKKKKYLLRWARNMWRDKIVR